MLADAGEPVHPASALLANESAHIEDESADHDLHAFQAIRRMDEILVNNFMVFNDVVDETYYDLVIGDEAWDVDYFLHENPELKRFAFAWMTDFVGWLPMPSGGDAEAALTADYNAEMLEQRARYRRLRDRSIFVGNPDDIVDASFGAGLPQIRDWTEANYDFAGYVTGFAPPSAEERAAVRARLGLRPGRPALRRDRRRLGRGRRAAASGDGRDPARAADAARAAVPRRDRSADRPRRRCRAGAGRPCAASCPTSTSPSRRATSRSCRAGSRRCMELAAAQRPFLYVPLENHFEQNFHVRHRLRAATARGAASAMPRRRDPGALAAALVEEVGREVQYRPVETDGAARAAAMLAELI